MREHEIYVPLHYNDGVAVTAEKLQELRAQLVEQFGGLTHFPQENAGLWKVGSTTFRDQIVMKTTSTLGIGLLRAAAAHLAYPPQRVSAALSTYAFRKALLLFALVGSAVLPSASAAESPTTGQSPTLSPLYAAKAGHPWDALREIFYARRFSNGAVYADPRTFQPPWVEYNHFVHSEPFYQEVLARIAAVEKLSAAEMEMQQPVRRFLFFRDLWPMFDGFHFSKALWIDPTAEKFVEAGRRRAELMRRLAAVMERLELTEDEVRSLPDTLALAGKERNYPLAFDLQAPEQPFFPADLLDPAGDWIPFAQSKDMAAGGQMHIGWSGFRSLFTLHARTPGGRAATLKFLDEYTASDGKKDIPPGSMLALLRRAAIPTTTGKVLATPVVESLHMIAVTPPQDRRLIFTLERPELLAGKHGLQLVGKDEHVDGTAFESIPLWSHPVPQPGEVRLHDEAGESLVIGRVDTINALPPAFSTCARCHGKTISSNLLGRNATRLFPQLQPEDALTSIRRQKEAEANWKAYLELRKEPSAK